MVAHLVFVYVSIHLQPYYVLYLRYVVVQVSGLSVSSGSDQLIVFHLTDGNDLVVCLVTTSGEERVGEVVGTLAKFWKKQ